MGMKHFNDESNMGEIFESIFKDIKAKAEECDIENMSVDENPIEEKLESIFNNIKAKAEEARQEPRHKKPAAGYKQLFLDAILAEDDAEKEDIFDNIPDEDVKVPVAVHFFKKFNSEKAEEYIKQNSKVVMHYLVENGDTETLSVVLQMINQGE